MNKINPDYISTHLYGSGWGAIHMRYYEDMKGYDCQQTGIGRYKTKEEAIKEAKEWSKAEEIEYRE